MISLAAKTARVKEPKRSGALVRQETIASYLFLLPSLIFFLGFVIAAFTTFNLVALGVIGLVCAIVYIQLNPKYAQLAAAPASSESSSDADDDLDDELD